MIIIIIINNIMNIITITMSVFILISIRVVIIVIFYEITSNTNILMRNYSLQYLCILSL
jgi:hypothetical protein